MAVKLLFVHALSSLHPGAGSGAGAIDLPITRERATNLPFVAGSSLKGCLNAKNSKRDDRDRWFGKSDEQGELQIADARLLLLPVRSFGSTFVWATSPYILRRFRRDCKLLDAGTPPQPTDPGSGEALSGGDLELVSVGGKLRLVLEDLDFSVRQGEAKGLADWIAGKLFPDEADWRAEFVKRFVVLPDRDFDFLCEFATEVNAHIKVGTKDDNNLWYEETLPAETVLVSLVKSDSEIPRDLIHRTLHIGGNATTGQGLVRLVEAPRD